MMLSKSFSRAICISSLEKCLFKSFAVFKLLLNCKNSLYIPYSRPLSDGRFMNIFYRCVGWLFVFCITVLILTKSTLFFLVSACAFGVVSKEPLPIPRSDTVLSLLLGSGNLVKNHLAKNKRRVYFWVLTYFPRIQGLTLCWSPLFWSLLFFSEFWGASVVFLSQDCVGYPWSLAFPGKFQN